MKEIHITIEGVTPLMMHAFHAQAQIDASGGSSSSIRAGDKGNPKEQAELFLYKNENGAIVMPQPNILRCLIDAGKYFKAGKVKVTTAKSSLIPGCMTIPGANVLVTHKQPWRVDARPVCNPSTGGRFLQYRPVFDDWKLSFIVELDDSVISAKLLREIVDIAGRRIGLGHFRPDKKGPFGVFKVTSWKVADLREAAE